MCVGGSKLLSGRHLYVCLYVCKRGNISMVVMCDDIDSEGCDRRTLELSNTSLYMKQDTTSIEK